MRLFKLIPVDLSDGNWRCSSHHGEILVRARDEEHARGMAMKEFGLFDPMGEGSCVCPWISPLLTRCEDMGASDDFHAAEILIPAKV